MQQIEQTERGVWLRRAEMAKCLKISLSEYRAWLEEIRPATFVCLDAAFNSEFDDSLLAI